MALCVARARAELETNSAVSARVTVSANIYKNGLGVGIPGTDGMTGLPIAAALGLVTGRWEDKLELLRGVNRQELQRAKDILARRGVWITIAQGGPKLYIHAEVTDGKGHTASCTIQNGHANIVLVQKDGHEIYRAATENTSVATGDQMGEKARELTIDTIYEFATTARIEDIAFIHEADRLNRAISEVGLSGQYGLGVGRRLNQQSASGILKDDLMLRAMSMTAAASDARMAGVQMPVMSNSGSGNQGLTATLPVLAAADLLKADAEKQVRALTLSHLVAIHIKGYIGRLSALCGCVVASAGAGCGVCYLLGGGLQAVKSTIQNMLGNVTGMVCDGAKVGCALKVSAGVSSAVTAALLAVDGVCIGSTDGIIEGDVERTIGNLGRLGQEGMRETDGLLLKIMLGKDHADTHTQE